MRTDFYLDTTRSRKEPSIIDVDMDEDEKDEDLLNESSSVVSSPAEEYNLHQGGYVGKEGSMTRTTSSEMIRLRSIPWRGD